jgi:hypothetical protein
VYRVVLECPSVTVDDVSSHGCYSYFNKPFKISYILGFVIVVRVRISATLSRFVSTSTWPFPVLLAHPEGQPSLHIKTGRGGHNDTMMLYFDALA